MEKRMGFTKLEVAEILRVIYRRMMELYAQDSDDDFQDCMEMVTLQTIISKLDALQKED